MEWSETLYSESDIAKFIFYENTYQSVMQEVVPIRKKIFLGNKSNKICRFCGKNEPNTTFSKDSHVFSELTGNKTLFSFYECDQCNEYFCKQFENHFANFLGLFRSILPFKGKRGFIKYKSQCKKSSISRNTENQIHIINNESDPIATIDRLANKITLKMMKNPYVPLFVYKLLVKFCLAVMPVELFTSVTEVNKWLMDKTSYGFNALYTPLVIYISGTHDNCEVKNIKALLFKNKNNKSYPEYSFIFSMYNIQFQIFIPSNEQINAKIKYPISFPFYGIIDQPNIQTFHGYRDFSSSQIIKEEDIYEFNY
jgi:hypothetical protein